MQILEHMICRFAASVRLRRESVTASAWLCDEPWSGL